MDSVMVVLPSEPCSQDGPGAQSLELCPPFPCCVICQIRGHGPRCWLGLDLSDLPSPPFLPPFTSLPFNSPQPPHCPFLCTLKGSPLFSPEAGGSPVGAPTLKVKLGPPLHPCPFSEALASSFCSEQPHVTVTLSGLHTFSSCSEPLVICFTSGFQWTLSLFKGLNPVLHLQQKRMLPSVPSFLLVSLRD